MSAVDNCGQINAVHSFESLFICLHTDDNSFTWYSPGRPVIGVGAGKFLVVRRNFARILPDLPEKYFKISDLQKKLFILIRAPLFSNQNMLGAIFAQVFREF